MTDLALDVLALPFGGPFKGRDSYGTFFTPRTDFWLDRLPLPVVLRIHGLKDGIPRVMAQAASYERRADGVWFSVRLKDTSENRALLAASRRGELFASSGAISHLVRIADSGEVLVWPVAEISLILRNERAGGLGPGPSNPYAVALPAVRANFEKIGGSFPMWVWNGFKWEWVGEGEPQGEPPASAPAPLAVAAVPEPGSQSQVAAPVETGELARVQAENAALRAQLTPRPPAPAVIRQRGESELWARGTPFVDGINAVRMGRFSSVCFELWPGVGVDQRGQPAVRVLSEGTAGAGGYVVPVEHSNKFVDMLRAASAFLRAFEFAGGVPWPMATDELHIPAQTAAGVAYYPGENAAITASDQTYAEVVLNAKKVTALTKMSAEVFEDSNPRIEQIVMNDLMRVLGLDRDIKVARGDGTGSTPLGLLNITAVTKTSLGANGATPTFDNLVDAVNRLDVANVPEDGRAWVIHPRTRTTLRKIKDTQNHYLWADPSAPGDPPTVWGYPVFMTTQIPINLTVGTSTDCSEIYLGAWAHLAYGQRKLLEIKASDEAGSAFENDQVFIRAIERYDVDVLHGAAFDITTGVRP